MRSTPTPAEARLWQALRANRLSGIKVRRQCPIGPFIADFTVPSAKLVIELDGSQHDDNQIYDSERTKWFESQGYAVLRFRNSDVTANLDGVLETILYAARPLSPLGERRVALSPEGEGA